MVKSVDDKNIGELIGGLFTGIAYIIVLLIVAYFLIRVIFG